MRKSSARLWPGHNHVEEQATERYADRERIGQLASPPFSTRLGSGIATSWTRMRQDGGGGIGPVDKIWRHGVVHGGDPVHDTPIEPEIADRGVLRVWGHAQ
jgi:hypothetical protein